jgi:4-hydroxybenzoate polyprenyltransferase
MARRVLSTIAVTARLGKLRYLALTLPPFIAGVIGDPENDRRYLVIGGLAVVVLRAISSVGNCLSDREEDAVDQPHRLALIDRVGYANVFRALIALIVVYGGLVIAMALALGVYLGAIVLWLVYLYLKLAYSFGPRFKPRRWSATVLLGGVPGAMFFVGWIGSGLHDVSAGVAGATLLWAFGASMSGSKDAPNVTGDLAIGYRSAYLDVVESHRPLRRAIAAASRPYLAAVPLALVTLHADGAGLTFLWCLVVYPVAVAFAVVLIRARTEIELSLVREVGYLYWTVCTGAVLITLVPDATVVAMTAGALVWYIAASRLIHPDPTPLSASGVRSIKSLLLKAPAPQRSDAA